MPLRTRANGNALRLAKRNVGERCYGANAPENLAPGYSLGQWDVPPYNGRVKITMSVTLAPELTEAIEESAERQGLSLDDWIVAAAELKFRADDEAAIFEEAEEKRRRAGLQEYLDEYYAEFGAPTEEELAESRRREAEGERLSYEYYARCRRPGLPAPACPEKSLALEMKYRGAALQGFGVEWSPPAGSAAGGWTEASDAEWH